MDLFTTSSDPMELIASHLFLKDQDNSRQTRLGKRGACRFCGATDRKSFKNTSHTIPRSLGNSRLVSLDECDECNRLFGTYDDHLVRFFGPYLAMVGLVSGKKPPKTKDARSSIERVGDRVSVKASVDEFGDAVRMILNPESGPELEFSLPSSRFVPVFAYFALCKQALSIVPPESLKDFSRLIDSLMIGKFEHSDELPEDRCIVSLLRSTSVHPVALGALLYRRNDFAPDVDLRWPKWMYGLQINEVMLLLPLLTNDWWSSSRQSYSDFGMSIAMKPPPLSMNTADKIQFAPLENLFFSSMEPTPSPFSSTRVQTRTRR